MFGPTNGWNDFTLYQSVLQKAAREIEVQIQKMKDYRSQLLTYQTKISEAQTLEELNALKSAYPENPSSGGILVTEGPSAQLNQLIAEGKALKEKISAFLATPPAVQQIQAEFQKLGFDVKVATIKTLPPSYAVTIVDGKIYVKAPTSGLKGMSFEVAADGTIKAETLVADYYAADAQTVQVKDGKLLYEAMTVCPQGQVCPAQVITPLSGLIRMTEVTVTKVENGVIAFTKEGKNYKAFRENGQVIVKLDMSLIEQAILQVAAAQKRLENAQKMLEQAGANVEAALAELKAAEQMKEQAEKMLQMATDLQKAAEAASNQGAHLAEVANDELDEGGDDQKAAAAEQAKINKLQNSINNAKSCIGGNIDVCKANGWTVLRDSKGNWYVPESTKKELLQDITVWTKEISVHTARKAAYLRSAADHYEKAKYYEAKAEAMYAKAAEYAAQSAKYLREGRSLMEQAIPRIKAAELRLQQAQKNLADARQNHLNATSNLRAAVERLQSLPGYQEVLREAKAAVAQAQTVLQQAQVALDRANQAMVAAQAELKAAEQMKVAAEKMLQMATEFQKIAEAASNQGADLAKAANNEVNAGRDDQDAAEAEQNKINKLQKFINNAKSCIGGNIDVCKANGWTVLRDKSGKWYVPASTIRDLRQDITVWTKEISVRAARAAAYLKSSASHYEKAKYYTAQSHAMYAKAKEYLARAKDYIVRGQAMMAQALERIKAAQIRAQQAAQALTIAKDRHLSATAVLRAATERLEMLQPKIIVGIEMAAMPK